MRSVIYLIFIVILLVACSSASPDATTPPTSTFTPEPTAPPTQVPLSELDLSSILIQPGDLSAGITGAQVRDMLPAMFDYIATPTVNQIYQEFEQDSTQKGGVAVMVYDNAADAKETFDMILMGMGGKAKTDEVQDLGDQARIGGYDLLFQRCKTVIHFRMFANADARITYAQRLDERLTPFACR
jgi:hypothetical protein